MRTLLRLLIFVLAGSIVLADPPDEDVHRPYVPGADKLFVQFDLVLNLTFLNGNSNARLLNPGEGPTDLFASASGLGPLISATVGYEISSIFSLTFRTDYDVRYAGRRETTVDTCDLLGVGAVPVDVDKEWSLNAQYLSLSTLGNLHIDQLFIFFGPTISIPLGSRFSETERIVDESSECNFFPFAPDEAKEVSGSTASDNANMRQRLSLKLGAGYVIPVSDKIDVVPQLGYDLGLNNVLLDDEVNFLKRDEDSPSTLQTIVNADMRLSSLQATIGIRIHL